MRSYPRGVQFVALSDHDDSWHSDKLETLLAAFDEETMLVYSDMNIVDPVGKRLAPTYWTTRLNNYSNLTSLVIANTITGAASMFRRSLLDYAMPFPQKIDQWSFHDQWLACTALSLGKVGYVNRPLYDYVQHGANVIGHFAPAQHAATRLASRTARALIVNRAAEFAFWQTCYLYLLLRVQLISQTLLTRLDGTDSSPGRRGKLRSLKRLTRLGAGPTDFSWLLLRGAPSLGARSVTLGTEYVLAQGLLWLALSRVRSWLGGGPCADVLSPPLASPIVLDRHGLSPAAEISALAASTGETVEVHDLPAAEAARAALPGYEMLREVANLRQRIAPLRLRVHKDAPRRVNLLIATVDPKYFSGGYISVFNIASRIAESGRRVRIVILDPCDFAPAKWRSWLREFGGLDRVVDEVEFSYQFPRSKQLEVSPSDVFVATVWWTAHLAHAAAQYLGKEGFIFLIQEYEPLFYPSGTLTALTAQSYDFPQNALFSTELLRTFFREQRIGVFKRGEAFGEAHSASFQNAITPISAPGSSS